MVRQKFCPIINALVERVNSVENKVVEQVTKELGIEKMRRKAEKAWEDVEKLKSRQRIELERAKIKARKEYLKVATTLGSQLSDGEGKPVFPAVSSEKSKLRVVVRQKMSSLKGQLKAAKKAEEDAIESIRRSFLSETGQDVMMTVGIEAAKQMKEVAALPSVETLVKRLTRRNGKKKPKALPAPK